MSCTCYLPATLRPCVSCVQSFITRFVEQLRSMWSEYEHEFGKCQLVKEVRVERKGRRRRREGAGCEGRGTSVGR